MPPERSLEELVEEVALELVHRHSLDEIEAVLRESGVSASLAAKLVLLLPSAFAAAHYGAQGLEFTTHFLVGPEHDRRELPYAAEPGYNEARSLAQRWEAEGRSSLIGRVLDWSAEANAIEEARAKGLTPTRLDFVHHGDVWED
jgi:hypothetical protein